MQRVGLLALIATGALAGSPLRIEPEGDWSASPADVLKVLHSAADPLWGLFPRRDLAAIKVEPKRGPIVLYRRGKQGEYLVRLNTGSTFWSQYAYQFSHEFTHILCNFREAGRHNKWFEEALAELGSIYSLRRMAETWKTDAPYPNWRNYAGHLQSYAQDLIDKTEAPVDLAAWYREHVETLRKDPTDRALNRVVSVHLLPRFERQPELWRAVAHLNDLEHPEEADFEAYLQAWYENAPRRFGPDILAIARDLGIELDPTR